MKLHEALHIDLKRIDDTLVSVVATDPDLPGQSIISDSVISLIRSGGKRLRPMLVIVGGKFGANPDNDALLRTSVMMEYLHMSSLIHDDIIDDSDLRRNLPALHKQTDIPTAIHIANYMMARAVEWASSHSEDVGKTAELASVVTELCLGEYQQLKNRFNFDLTLDQYIEKTRNKTALLMATCLKAGAEDAEADPDIAELLYKFGDALGTAFQIRDDVLDFIQSSEILGKPAGSDLLNGNVTLPVLYALENPGLSKEIRSLNTESSKEEISRAVAGITKSDAIERSLELSAQYAAEAEAIIRKLSGYPAYRDLETLLHYFINREK
jgi:heptaprenyl diphosphate synthase